MSTHHSYLSPFVENPEYQKFGVAIALGLVLILIGKGLTKKLSSDAGIEKAVIPPRKANIFASVDFLLETFLNYQDSILGKENRKYAPFTATVFFFILIANLIGLIPGIPAITTTVWINVAMALVVFVYFNYQGVKANGALGYLAHFCGPFWWLAWLIFPIEIVSTFIRILTLNLRLYWNITADHIVLGIFTDLAWIVPIVFYILGTFVCFMQAFVFTTLTMVYILLATQHEEGDHH